MESADRLEQNEKLLGLVAPYKHNDKFFIMNCFSQEKNFDTNYEAVEKCFETVKRFMENAKLKTVGIPFNYGCGIANGDWDKVESILKNIFEDCELELQVWKL